MSGTDATGSRPSGRFLAREIIGATALLVRHVMRRDWRAVAATAHRRRTLLTELESGRLALDAACVEALRQAVLESDIAVAAMRSNQVAAWSAPVVR